VLIDNSEIDAFGTIWFQTNSPSNTIDDNFSTCYFIGYPP
jgi:hypothetical protein